MSNSNFGIETNFEMNSFDEESLPLPFQSDLLLSSLDFLGYDFLDSKSIDFNNIDSVQLTTATTIINPSTDDPKTSTDLKEKIEELIQNRKKKRNQTKTAFRLQCFSQISPKEFVYIRRNKKRIQIGKNFSLKKHGMEISDKIVITSKLIDLETQINKRNKNLIRRSYRNAFKPKGFIIAKPHKRGDLVFKFVGKHKKQNRNIRN
ncbi:hypothetical protein M0811_00392 [Anaeramoeba ignava]|uniref:Uncharacterized protein n=1 Tax=Anaeramoeba ignava TaxID=1746090 RepID=A0A9Q0LQA4_ANAIG|nr:hypothetical protein M0811_00392 [Anaeramoeba ignava]